MSNLWITPEDLGDKAESLYAEEACETASFLLWGLSGRKYAGLTTITEVYAAPAEGLDSNLKYAAQTTNYGSYRLFANPARPNTSINLRGTHVQEVIEIKVGTEGDVISDEDYVVYDYKAIQFMYPIYEDIAVTYTYGTPIPAAGRMAAKMLATQFAMAWEGDENCSLPDRVTSVSRQGISYTILDQQDFIADLRTGVYAVDLFLKTVNPDRALRKARVFSPDTVRGRRPRTNTNPGYGAGGYGTQPYGL